MADTQDQPSLELEGGCLLPSWSTQLLFHIHRRNVTLAAIPLRQSRLVWICGCKTATIGWATHEQHDG